MVRLRSRRPAADAPIAILTGPYGARVLAPLVDELLQRQGRGGMAGAGVRIVEVQNRYFGGNIGVTGLMVGNDVHATLAAEPPGHRYLLPDVCLSRGVFLDGVHPDDLPHPIEIVGTDGVSLRHALNVTSADAVSVGSLTNTSGGPRG